MDDVTYGRVEVERGSDPGVAGSGRDGRTGLGENTRSAQQAALTATGFGRRPSARLVVRYGTGTGGHSGAPVSLTVRPFAI